MNELQAIVRAYDRWRRDGLPLALATVVDVHGSAYRRPGARMLVGPAETVGGLSAGCLEQDVAERSRRVLGSGRPAIVRYDTTAEADMLWGLGLGCNGVVDVLIEPLPADRLNRQLAFLADLLSQRRTGAVATVFRARGPALAPGARLFLPPICVTTRRIRGRLTRVAS